MRKIKLIIFDWDDVFTRGSKEGYFNCYHQALEKLGIVLNPAEEKKRILAKWGQPHREELRELLKEHLKLLDQAVKNYDELMFGDAFVGKLSMIPGSKKLVKKLSDKYILTVATGVDPAVLHNRVIPKFGFPDVFSQIVSAYDLVDPKLSKPDPYMAELILKTQKAKPNEAVLVGDAKSDVLMAQAAQVTPIVVLTGHLTKPEAEKLGVRYIIPDITYLEKVLNKLNE